MNTLRNTDKRQRIDLFGIVICVEIIACVVLLALIAFEPREVEQFDPEPEIIAGETTELPADDYIAQEVHLYTEADAVALAQMAWGEAGGVRGLQANGRTISAECQQAATMWCALNRYDAGYYYSIVDVIAAPRQFHGYDPDSDVDADMLALAFDVLDRWEREKLQGGDVGRVLPADYLFFVGDGKHNHFTKEYGSGVYYTWELPDVYEEENR